MSDYLRIILTGCDGSTWNLSGPDAGAEGVEMRPKMQMMIDAPVKTFWIKSAYAVKYQGYQAQRRDPLFSVSVGGRSEDEWHYIDSRFRMALGTPDDVFKITFITSDGERNLDLRLLEQPKAYETAEFEGRDPHLYRESTLVVPAAAEQPYWYADDAESSATLSSGSSGTLLVDLINDGDVPAFPRWEVSAPGTWLLPDLSWGSDVYGRAVTDFLRYVTLPTLVSGEDLDVDTYPDAPATLVAANGAPVIYRWNGRGFLYPIAPHKGILNAGVGVSGATAGAEVKVFCRRRYSRPWGVQGVELL